MQKASELVPSGMLSVVGRPQSQYKYACLQAKEHCKSQGIEEPVCSVANYLFPDGRVIAGHQQVWKLKSISYQSCSGVLQRLFHQSCLRCQALDFLQQNSRRLQFTRTKPLPVSGAFHTELMRTATEPLREVLRQVEVRLLCMTQALPPTLTTQHAHVTDCISPRAARICLQFLEKLHLSDTKISLLFRCGALRSGCTPTWMESATWMRTTCADSSWSSWCRLWSGSKLCTRSTRGLRERSSPAPTRSDRESSSVQHFRGVTGRPSQHMHA